MKQVVCYNRTFTVNGKTLYWTNKRNSHIKDSGWVVPCWEPGKRSFKIIDLKVKKGLLYIYTADKKKYLMTEIGGVTLFNITEVK